MGRVPIARAVLCYQQYTNDGTPLLINHAIAYTEKDVQQWMESVLGEPFPADLTFAQALKDGQVGVCVYGVCVCVYMYV